MKTLSQQKQKVSSDENLLKAGFKNNGHKSNGTLKKQVWNYSKSVEDSKAHKIEIEYDLYIGKWIKTKKYFDTINPSNEEVIAKSCLRLR